MKTPTTALMIRSPKRALWNARRCMLGVYLFRAVLCALMVIINTALHAWCMEIPLQSPDSQSSILEVKGETVRVKLLAAFSGEVISNSDVEVHSDNGIRCIRAPCPTNAKQWQGKSDANGYVVIPTNVLQPVTRIWTPAHKQGKDLVRDSEKDAAGAWVIELYPNHVSDSAGLGLRPIKLVDAQSDRPLSDTAVHIAFGETDSFEGTTNSLGYIFIPFEKAVPALENTWVTASGYQKAKIDFAGVNYRAKLERQ